MSTITRTEDVFGDHLEVDLAERCHLALVLMKAERDPSYLERAPRPVPELAEGLQAIAYVSHSRWVADCPFPGCHSALIVSPADPRFFCVECFNAPAEGRYVEVVFPAPARVRALEELLEVRPVAETRNWFPHETPADLRRENEEHGV